MGKTINKDYPLKTIFETILKRIWIILICVIIGTTGSFLISKYVIEEQFTASVSMYVTPNIKSTDADDYLNYLSYSQQIIDTYAHLLKTNSFMREVADASGLRYTEGDLNKMIEVEVLDDTELFRISVTSKSPKDSLKLANTAATLAPEKILEMKTANSVSVVDKAVMPKIPSSPNIIINTIIGFVFGLAFGYLIANVLELLDNRIKDEDDFIMNYDIPILGIIPRIK